MRTVHRNLDRVKVKVPEDSCFLWNEAHLGLTLEQNKINVFTSAIAIQTTVNEYISFVQLIVCHSLDS